jgi:hypothetical protein
MDTFAQILSKVPKCAKCEGPSYTIFNLIIIKSRAQDVSRSLQITANRNTPVDPMAFYLR